MVIDVWVYLCVLTHSVEAWAKLERVDGELRCFKLPASSGYNFML